MKNNYKPKAKNEIALKIYIKDADNKSNERDKRGSDSKRKRSRNNNIR